MLFWFEFLWCGMWSNYSMSSDKCALFVKICVVLILCLLVECFWRGRTIIYTLAWQIYHWHSAFATESHHVMNNRRTVIETFFVYRFFPTCSYANCLEVCSTEAPIHVFFIKHFGTNVAHSNLLFFSITQPPLKDDIIVGRCKTVFLLRSIRRDSLWNPTGLEQRICFVCAYCSTERIVWSLEFVYLLFSSVAWGERLLLLMNPNGSLLFSFLRYIC